MTKRRTHGLFLLLLPFLALAPPILERVRGLHSTQVTVATMVACALVCLVGGVILVLLDKPSIREKKLPSYTRAFLISLLVIAYFDIAFDGRNVAASALGGLASLDRMYRIAIVLAAVVVMLVGLTLLVRRHESNVLGMSILGFGVIFASTLLISGQRPLDNWTNERNDPTTARRENPVAVYIVWDEMIGAEGVDQTVAGGTELYRRIRAFHENHGFRLFGQAFSRHAMTTASVSLSLNGNFEDSAEKKPTRKVDNSFVVEQNRFFDKLGDDGRRVIVYQTPFLNFCDHRAVARCETLSIFDPFNGYVPESYRSFRFHYAIMALKAVLARSIMLHVPANLLYDAVYEYPASYETNETRAPELAAVAVLSTEAWVDKFFADVLGSQRGDVYFSHFLFPHQPFVLTEDCSPRSSWQPRSGRLEEAEGLVGPAFERARTGHHKAYYQQMNCVYDILDRFMTEIEGDEHLRDATVVLMGDHGSRISRGLHLESLEARDFIDNYSTHFSIRSSETTPGFDARLISTQQLFGAFGINGTLDDSVTVNRTVSVRSVGESAFLTIPMPEFLSAPNVATGVDSTHG